MPRSLVRLRREKGHCEVKRLGAGELASWSVAGPAFVEYVGDRTSAEVACCNTGKLVALMRRGSLGHERGCTDIYDLWCTV